MEIKVFNQNKDYHKDTLGYHYKFSIAFFGEDSAPSKWLYDKAQSCEKGFDEGVVIPEEQVVYLLGHMYLKEREKE